MHLRSGSAMRDLWDGTSKPVLSLNEQSQVADHQSWDDASAQFTWPHMIYTFAITGNIASSRDRGREFWTRIAAPCQPRFPPQLTSQWHISDSPKKEIANQSKSSPTLGPRTTLTVPHILDKHPRPRCRWTSHGLPPCRSHPLSLTDFPTGAH